MVGHKLSSVSSDTYLAFLNRPTIYWPLRAVCSGPCNAFIRMKPMICSRIMIDVSKLRPHATSANGRSGVSFSYGEITCRNRHFRTNALSESTRRVLAHG